MAPAVIAAPARASSRRWSRQRTSLQEVTQVLARLARETAQHDRDEAEHPHPRLCVLNLVAVIPETESFRRVEAVAEQLARNHPLRLLALRLHPGPGRDLVAARVSSHFHMAGPGIAVQHDQVELEITGGVSRALREVVEPLLVPDVMTVLWWDRTPPLESRSFLEMADMGGMLVVDSARFDEPAETLGRLAALTRRGRLGIADLDWGRNRGWREALSQVFAPRGRRAFLERVDRLEVDYAGGAGASRIPAALLAGWIRSQVGPGRSRPQLRPTGGRRLRPGEIRELRISARDDQRLLELAVARDGGYLHVALAIDGADPVRQVLPVDAPTDAELVVSLTSHGRRDGVFHGALVQAARILQRRS